MKIESTGYYTRRRLGKEILGGTTGSVVKRPVAGSVLQPRHPAPQQAYFYALRCQDRSKKRGMDTAQQNCATNAQIRSAEEALLPWAWESSDQGDRPDRQTPGTLRSGRRQRASFSRNISPGQRFDRGTEWYRIADLSRVWILADIYENEAQYFRPGSRRRLACRS